jgi:2-polyprenyl-3-methyl-5-hydroxy-6-metoxy-1,4-benzoquinol methylase
MKSDIQSQRKIAALSSGGISSQPVYSKFLYLVEELSLQGDCLDFGAGLGNLTKLFQNLGHFNSVTAVDIMQRPDSINKLVKWIDQDLNQPLLLPDQQFDVIFSSEVIEHLENPRGIVREWFRLLRPCGTLIFSTPNNESWRSLLALMLQGHFVAFGDTCYPAHITALLRKDIERILNETGFINSKFIFTDFGRIPKFPQLNYQTISFNTLKRIRYSDNLLVVATKPV